MRGSRQSVCNRTLAHSGIHGLRVRQRCPEDLGGLLRVADRAVPQLGEKTKSMNEITKYFTFDE